MKTILSSMRHHYLARAGIFLIAVALIAGMVGCGGGGGDGGVEYDLTIASTAGGSVTTPGEAGPYTYDEGEMVNLVATPDAGYQFDKWTGDTGTIADPNGAATTITMNSDCSITANFAVAGYTLTIASDIGGSVLTPGEGTFTYSTGAVVDLVASGYCTTVGNCRFAYGFCDWTGDTASIADTSASITTITMNGDYSITANFQIGLENPMIAAGASHTVGLKTDGTVVATAITDPLYDHGQSDVGGWTDIIQVDAGVDHTVGLRSDGTVVATEIIDYPFLEEFGLSDVDSWTDIIQVAAGAWHTVGLRSDGTVVATGLSSICEDVDSWTDIIQVAAGEYHIVGLRSNGTVVAAGDNDYDRGQFNVDSWMDIVQVAAGWWNTVGLKSDGTVLAVGDNDSGQCNVDGWTHIVEVDGGALHTVGRVLYSSGGSPPMIISKVVSTGWNRDYQCDVDGWTLLTQIAAGYNHTVGLKSDGTLIVVGCTWDDRGQCNVGGWDLDS
jgi:hypothetical protein